MEGVDVLDDLARDQLYRDAEDALTAHFGEASDEEEYANVADVILGDLVDLHRGAVEDAQRLRDQADDAYRSLDSGRPAEALEYLRSMRRPARGR